MGNFAASTAVRSVPLRVIDVTQASLHDDRRAGSGQAPFAGRHHRRNPYLVGFEPQQSLVVLSLRGPRSRLGLTARIDLPAARSATACARNFVNYLKRDGAARAIIVFYPPSDGIAHPSVKPLADALIKHLTRARIGVQRGAVRLRRADGGRCNVRTTSAARRQEP